MSTHAQRARPRSMFVCMPPPLLNGIGCLSSGPPPAEIHLVLGPSYSLGCPPSTFCLLLLAASSKSPPPTIDGSCCYCCFRRGDGCSPADAAAVVIRPSLMPKVAVGPFPPAINASKLSRYCVHLCHAAYNVLVVHRLVHEGVVLSCCCSPKCKEIFSLWRAHR